MDSDPGTLTVVRLLTQLGIRDADSIAGEILTAVDDARRQAGWIVVPTMPCPHVDVRIRHSDPPLRYCAQCGEDMPADQPTRAELIP